MFYWESINIRMTAATMVNDGNAKPDSGCNITSSRQQMGVGEDLRIRNDPEQSTNILDNE